MKYKDFIFESISETERKKELDLDECVKIFKEHCKKYDVDKKPFIRGYNGKSDYMIVQGDVQKRSSRTKKNHANIIIDQNIMDVDKTYPRRQYSIIFAGQKSHEHVLNFGSRVYNVIPYDDCKFAYCEGEDLNYIEMPDMDDMPFGAATGLSRYLDMNDISDDDFETIAMECLHSIEDEYSMDRFKKLFHGCTTLNDVTKRLKELLPLNKLSIKFTNDVYKVYDTDYEVWTNGKCLLIDSKHYDGFLEKLKEK